MVSSTFATLVQCMVIITLQVLILDSIWMARLISNKIVVQHRWGSETLNLNLNNCVDEVYYTTTCSTDNQYIFKPAPKSLFWAPISEANHGASSNPGAKKAIARLIGQFEHTSGNSLSLLAAQNKDLGIASQILAQVNRPCYEYSGHIEFITFKEYYGMPRGHEHDPIFWLSICMHALWANFSLSFPWKRLLWGKKDCCAMFAWLIMNAFFLRNIQWSSLFAQKACVSTERVPPGHPIILLKSNKFNMAAVSVKRSIYIYQ